MFKTTWTLENNLLTMDRFVNIFSFYCMLERTALHQLSFLYPSAVCKNFCLNSEFVCAVNYTAALYPFSSVTRVFPCECINGRCRLLHVCYSCGSSSVTSTYTVMSNVYPVLLSRLRGCEMITRVGNKKRYSTSQNCIYFSFSFLVKYYIIVIILMTAYKGKITLQLKS